MLIFDKKRKMKVFYILTLLLATITTIDAQNYWEHVGDTSLSTSLASKTEIESSLDGSLYLCYQYSSSPLGLTVRKYNGVNWDILGTEGFDGNVQYGRIEILPPNSLYFYSNNAFDNETYVQEYNGVSWDTVGGMVHGAITGPHCMDLKFNQGIPYVSFGDNSMGGYGSVKKLNGAIWEYVGQPGFTNIGAYDMEIFFYQDTLYSIIKPSGGSLTTHKFNGIDWEVVETGVASAISNDIDVKLDNNGVPYLSYYDWTDEYVRVMSFNGGGWSQIGAFYAADAEDTSLDFDENNRCYLSFQKGAGTEVHLVLMVLENGNWNTIAQGFTSGTAASPNVNIANSSVYYVSYANGNDGGKAAVLKYDIANKIDEYFAKKEQLVYPNPATDFITVKSVGIKTVKVLDASGKVVLSANSNKFDVSELPEGVYVIQVETDKGIEYSKLVRN